jgi:ankyrin repeat protein
MSTMRSLVAALVITAFLSVPAAAAQFSDRYTFFKAVKDGDVYKAKTLLDQPGSALINLRDTETGGMALHIVAKRRDIPWINFLISEGADVNVRDTAGNTPLMAAAQLGFVDGVTTLLQRKANVNLANSRGETPLIIAVQLRSAQVVRELLNAGANADLADHVAGMSARDYATNDRRASAILRLITENDKKAVDKTAKPVS